MPRFFTPDATPEGVFIIGGEDAAHIVRTLRMRAGETLTVCDGAGTDYACRIGQASADAVSLRALAVSKNSAEPSVQITLYAGMPKADRAEWIVQKAVELGACEIVFFAAARSVARPDDFTRRAVRLVRIAREAAMQSGRGVIPAVRGLLSAQEAFLEAARADCSVFCYEEGGVPLKTRVTPAAVSYAVITGPEGGFEPDEAAQIAELGIPAVTLGKRILRCETAPVCAVSAILYATDNL